MRSMEADDVAQVTMDAVTNFHATHKTIEWQRYLLSPKEISFLQYYRELLGPDQSLVTHTTEAALFAKVLSGLLSAGGVHQDQRKVILDGCNGKAGLMRLIKDLVKK